MYVSQMSIELKTQWQPHLVAIISFILDVIRASVSLLYIMDMGLNSYGAQQGIKFSLLGVPCSRSCIIIDICVETGLSAIMITSREQLEQLDAVSYG